MQLDAFTWSGVNELIAITIPLYYYFSLSMPE